jgi:hypothetical protein
VLAVFREAAEEAVEPQKLETQAQVAPEARVSSS